jgi:hypothetical protein
MDIRGRSGYLRYNLNRTGHQNGFIQNRTMNKNSRAMAGDCVRVILRGLRELFRFLFLSSRQFVKFNN